MRNEMIDFTGKVALVTGAGGGIGYQTTEQMLRGGAMVVMADNNETTLRTAAKNLDPEGKRTLAIQVDVSSSASVAALFTQAAAWQGGIDFLVHCAGMYPEAFTKDCSDELWQRLMRVNLDGTFFICREALPHLRDNSSIVLCASMAGHKGSYAHSAYAASKGGTLAFMHSIAMEYAPKTRVNCVSPGIIATSMTGDLISERGQALLAATPLKRFGDPAEVASVIIFLCSPLASFVTGETIHINGGMFMD